MLAYSTGPNHNGKVRNTTTLHDISWSTKNGSSDFFALRLQKNTQKFDPEITTYSKKLLNFLLNHFLTDCSVFSQLTPADEHVDDEVSVLGEDDDEQRVKVQTLHQQPEEVSHDEVLEEHQAGFTSHLKNTKVRHLNSALKGLMSHYQ